MLEREGTVTKAFRWEEEIEVSPRAAQALKIMNMNNKCLLKIYSDKQLTADLKQT